VRSIDVIKNKYTKRGGLGFELNRAEQSIKNVIYMFQQVKEIENSIVLLQLYAIKINGRFTE